MLEALRQLRLDPKIEVVTYSVIVDVENAGAELMSGMTALVTIVIEERCDAMVCRLGTRQRATRIETIKQSTLWHDVPSRMLSRANALFRT